MIVIQITVKQGGNEQKENLKVDLNIWDECQSENKKHKTFVQKVRVTMISPGAEIYQ